MNDVAADLIALSQLGNFTISCRVLTAARDASSQNTVDVKGHATMVVRKT